MFNPLSSWLPGGLCLGLDQKGGLCLVLSKSPDHLQSLWRGSPRNFPPFPLPCVSPKSASVLPQSLLFSLMVASGWEWRRRPGEKLQLIPWTIQIWIAQVYLVTLENFFGGKYCGLRRSAIGCIHHWLNPGLVETTIACLHLVESANKAQPLEIRIFSWAESAPLAPQLFKGQL